MMLVYGIPREMKTGFGMAIQTIVVRPALPLFQREEGV